MVERQARDLEVRVRVPVQVQIFLLKFDKFNKASHVSVYGQNRKTLKAEIEEII